MKSVWQQDLKYDKNKTDPSSTSTVLLYSYGMRVNNKKH